MARRKDHSPEELRSLLLVTTRQLIARHGAAGLTARRLATAVGYAPGTIYNQFKDMDALVLAVHGQTLQDMLINFQAVIAAQPADFRRIRALAQAYCDFAQNNRQLWLALFAAPRTSRPPRWYQEKLRALFGLIEAQLRLCLHTSPAASRRTARLLWACLHGITLLTLDGRMGTIANSDCTAMVDELLERYRKS